MCVGWVGIHLQSHSVPLKRQSHEILMDMVCVPGSPLDVFFKFIFSYSFKLKSFKRVKLLLLHLAKA